MQEQKISNKTVVQALSVKIKSSSRIIRESPDPPAKPPGPSFIDRNLKAGKFVLKVLKWIGQIGSAIRGLKTLWDILGRQRQPAEAAEVEQNGSYQT